MRRAVQRRAVSDGTQGHIEFDPGGNGAGPSGVTDNGLHPLAEVPLPDMGREWSPPMLCDVNDHCRLVRRASPTVGNLDVEQAAWPSKTGMASRRIRVFDPTMGAGVVTTERPRPGMRCRIYRAVLLASHRDGRRSPVQHQGWPASAEST
jgi:hypothetical protein